MKTIDSPVADLSGLRRDLYRLMSVLFADRHMAESARMAEWVSPFYVSEVNRQVVYLAVSLRGLLDLLPRDGSDAAVDFGNMVCGRYCPDFPGGAMIDLRVRQSLNSAIHAREIWPYEMREEGLESGLAAGRSGRKAHAGIITIRGEHRGLQTRAFVDMMRFVEIADLLIRHFEEAENAN